MNELPFEADFITKSEGRLLVAIAILVALATQPCTHFPFRYTGAKPPPVYVRKKLQVCTHAYGYMPRKLPLCLQHLPASLHCLACP